MAKFIGLTKEQGHQPRSTTTVLLMNLGTPSAPTTSAVRRYLAEFLADPRVVEIPKLLWMLILHGIILRVRPAKSAALYQKIWGESGSPLMEITQKQTVKLAQALSDQGEKVNVEFCMRYGEPSVKDILNRLHQQGTDKLVVLPLYPQYAAPTTASAFDALTQELHTWRYLPSVHFINTYHDNPAYISALVRTIERDFEQHGKPKKLVLSYHGMPERNLHLGDPYYCFCRKTTRLVVEQLGLQEGDYVTTFQSRFGKAKWLQPYTDATLQSLAREGIDDVAIICPAFSADCLETLEEIEHENRQLFIEAGGNRYRYIAALNYDEAHIAMMKQLVKPYLK